MIFTGSLRANTASWAKQFRSSHAPSRALHTSLGTQIATSLASPRRFSTSLVVPARSSPYLHSPRWSGNKPAPTTPSEHGNDAADSSTKSVKLDSPEDESPAGSSAQSPPPSSSSSGDSGDGSDPPSPPPQPTPTPSSIAKQSVPEIYPQVLALPIARRPLFPGFYKAVVVRNPAVVAAIKEMMKRGQPYLGAFLLKDEQTDSDVITDINSVHPVGVFAQITSVFAANSGTGDDKEEGLTAVLYPHRRIKITELIKAGEHASSANVQEETQTVTPPPSPSLTEGDVAKIPPGMSFTTHHNACLTSLRSSANLVPPQTLYLHCSGRQPYYTTVQQRRPVHPRLHV